MDIKTLKHITQAFFQAMKSKKYVPIEHINNKENLLVNKVVLIIGASGGIGSAIAREVSASGGKLILAGRNIEKLKKLSDEIGENVKRIEIDTSKTKDIKKEIYSAVKFFGKIDILINVAGVHSTKPMTTFLNISVDDYEKIMSVNLEGTYFACQAIAKYFIDSKISGHILNVSSSTAGEPSWSAYRLSKRGVESLTTGLAQSLTKYGITVNGIAPGSTATELLGFKKGDSIYTTDNEVGRYIMPEEVATYAVMLVSDLGDMVVGDTLYISGGRGTYDIR